MADQGADVSEYVLKAIAADQPMLQLFGISLIKARDGMCVLEARLTDSLINAGGVAHGGVAYVMADSACAYALRSREVRGVTVHANMSYHRGARAGTVMTATAKVVSLTRRTASLQAEITHEEILLAHGSFSFLLMDPQQTS